VLEVVVLVSKQIEKISTKGSSNNSFVQWLKQRLNTLHAFSSRAPAINNGYEMI
jgi:hypothetical protein